MTMRGFKAALRAGRSPDPPENSGERVGPSKPRVENAWVRARPQGDTPKTPARGAEPLCAPRLLNNLAVLAEKLARQDVYQAPIRQAKLRDDGQGHKREGGEGGREGAAQLGGG